MFFSRLNGFTMPFPLVAAVGAGAQLAGAGIDAFATGNQNRKSREFSEKMYDKQKADNIAFWSMQNDYNSPQAQMQRFQDAGLNPNLIYGQGNSGNSGAISTPDVQAPQFRSPEFGRGVQLAGLTFMNSMYDLDIKQAQLDNLKAQNSVIVEDAMLRRAQTAATDVNARRGEFNLDYESELRPISAESRREQLRQLKTNVDLSINEDARRAIANSTSVQEAAERILSMRAERTTIPFRRGQMAAGTAEAYERIRQMQKDGTLKDLDIALRKQGINPQDPMWSRIVGRVLSSTFESGSLRSAGSSIWDWFTK